MLYFHINQRLVSISWMICEFHRVIKRIEWFTINNDSCSCLRQVTRDFDKLYSLIEASWSNNFTASHRYCDITLMGNVVIVILVIVIIIILTNCFDIILFFFYKMLPSDYNWNYIIVDTKHEKPIGITQLTGCRTRVYHLTHNSHHYFMCEVYSDFIAWQK